jgi:hypothetical protein
MAMTIPNEAEVNWLKLAVNDIAGTQAWRVHLYQTDVDIDEDTTLAILSAEEADYSGYPSQGETFTWNTPAANGGTGKAEVTSADNVEFAHDGGATPNDCYGYYITQGDSSDYLLGCERFSDAPRVMNSVEDVFTISPALTLRQEP